MFSGPPGLLKTLFGTKMELSTLDQELVLSSMKYWDENWDFECPALFGIEQDDLRTVIQAWPENLKSGGSVVGRAISHSFSELLWGASSLSNAELVRVLGRPKGDIEKFYNRIQEEIKVMRDG